MREFVEKATHNEFDNIKAKASLICVLAINSCYCYIVHNYIIYEKKMFLNYSHIQIFFLVLASLSSGVLNADLRERIHKMLINDDAMAQLETFHEEKEDIQSELEHIDSWVDEFSEVERLQLANLFEELLPIPQIKKIELISNDIDNNFNFMRDVFTLYKGLTDENKREFLSEIKKIADGFIENYNKLAPSFENKDLRKVYSERRSAFRELELKYDPEKLKEFLEKEQRKAEQKIKAAQIFKEYEDAIKNQKITYDKQYILDNLSINVTWISKEINPQQEYIFPSVWKRQNVEIDIIGRIMDWAKNYNNINIWYDSAKVTNEQITKTIGEINSKLKESQLERNIKLKDIRDLEIIKENSDVLGFNFYFDLDLSRAVASYETLKNSQKVIFFLYADLSIDPNNLPPDKLLDYITIVNLNRFGIVQGRSNHYENSFHIWGNNHPELLKAIKHVLINLNIKRMLEAKDAYQKEKLTQAVYSSYPLMFNVYSDLSNIASSSLYDRNNKKLGSWRDMSDADLDQFLWDKYHNHIQSPPYLEVFDHVLKYLIQFDPVPVHPVYVPGSHFG